jgi:hypothetical protein
MRNLLAVILTVLALVVSTTSNAATNYLCDTLAPQISSPLKTVVVSFPSQIVTKEGVPSNPYSSIRHESDYFLVPTDNTMGGRLLRMRPFSTSDARPWYGIEETNVVFLDVLTQELVSAPLTVLVDASGTKTHRATVTVDNKDFYVHVYYALSPRYPATILTWGREASYGQAGFDVDDLTCSLTEPEVVPGNNIIDIKAMRPAQGKPDPTLFLISLERPLHIRHQIEFSPDKINWGRINRSNLMMNDGLNEIGWRSEYRSGTFRITVP